MERRGFFASLVAFLATPFSPRYPQRPYTVPATLWFENEKGERYVPAQEELQRGMPVVPEGFIYMWSQLPCQLEESCCTDKGQVMTAHSSWSQDLVLAMVLHGGYKLSEAILIAAHLCERCMNVAAFDYKLPWGYAHGSAEYLRCGTSCEQCEPRA